MIQNQYKKCKNCGKLTRNQKFCSMKCRTQKIKKRCKYCKKIFYVIPSRFNVAKYCSYKCYRNSQKNLKIKKNCKICNKIFYVIPCLVNKRKHCSRKCQGKTFGKIYGKIGGKNSQKTLKKLRKSFYNSSIQKELSKRADGKGGRIGGVIAQKTLRENYRNLLFNSQFYDSPQEIEFSICLQKQFNYVPKEGKTLHIRLKGGEIDFLLENLKLFIEEHRYFRNETEQQYFNRRRRILDENGYEDYKLIVIK